MQAFFWSFGLSGVVPEGQEALKTVLQSLRTFVLPLAPAWREIRRSAHQADGHFERRLEGRRILVLLDHDDCLACCSLAPNAVQVRGSRECHHADLAWQGAIGPTGPHRARAHGQCGWAIGGRLPTSLWKVAAVLLEGTSVTDWNWTVEARVQGVAFC